MEIKSSARIVNAIKSYKGVENAVQSMGEGPSSGFKLKHAIESARCNGQSAW